MSTLRRSARAAIVVAGKAGFDIVDLAPTGTFKDDFADLIAPCG